MESLTTNSAALNTMPHSVQPDDRYGEPNSVCGVRAQATMAVWDLRKQSQEEQAAAIATKMAAELKARSGEGRAG